MEHFSVAINEVPDVFWKICLDVLSADGVSRECTKYLVIVGYLKYRYDFNRGCHGVRDWIFCFGSRVVLRIVQRGSASKMFLVSPPESAALRALVTGRA